MSKDTSIRDARQLGYPKMMLLGFQHMFAMFGATVLVPILTGLSGLRDAAVRGSGHAAVPPPDQGQGARVPGFVLRLPRRLRGGQPMLDVEDETAMNWIPYACVGVMAARV